MPPPPPPLIFTIKIKKDATCVDGKLDLQLAQNRVNSPPRVVAFGGGRGPVERNGTVHIGDLLLSVDGVKTSKFSRASEVEEKMLHVNNGKNEMVRVCVCCLNASFLVSFLVSFIRLCSISFTREREREI